MTRARKLATWPLVGIVLVVGTTLWLTSVRTRAAAEEAAEPVVTEGKIMPAPSSIETARPSMRNFAASRTGVSEFRAPRADRKFPSDKSAMQTEPQTTSNRPPSNRPGLTGPAPINQAGLAAPATTTLASPAPTDAAPSLAGVGLKLLLGSLVLAGLLYAASRWLKRTPFAKFLPGTESPIKVIGRTHLGPKASLCLVEVGSTTLLVSMTGTSIQTLHVWPDGATVAPGVDRQGFKLPAPAAPIPGQLRHLESRLTGRNG